MVQEKSGVPRSLTFAIAIAASALAGCQAAKNGAASTSATPSNIVSGERTADGKVVLAGDSWRQRYLQWRAAFVHDVVMDGKTLSIVAMGPKNELTDFSDGTGARSRWNTTTSEAIGYGLYLLARAAADGEGDGRERELFDRMWAFAQAMPSPASAGEDGIHLMSWQWDPESPLYQRWKADPVAGKRLLGSAADGDIWIARALILADKVWGSKDAVNYQRSAKALLTLILRHTVGPQSKLITLGDWVIPNQPIEASTPGCAVKVPITGEYVTRTSDFVWSFFADFYHWSGNPIWLEVIDATQSAVIRAQEAYAAKLIPDVLLVERKQVRGADFDVFCDSTEAGLDRFGWNAVRDPLWWNLHAQSASGTVQGQRSAQILAAMGTQIVARGIDTPAKVGYEHQVQSGVSAGHEYESNLYVASFLAARAYAVVGADQAEAHKVALQGLYDRVSADRFDDAYFDDTVVLIALKGLRDAVQQSGAATLRN